MYAALVLSFLATFRLASTEEYRWGQSIICAGCKDVDPYNHCVKTPFTCVTKVREYCYSRMVSLDGTILFVDRGCTSQCAHIRTDDHYRNITTCCKLNYCNRRNYWPYN